MIGLNFNKLNPRQRCLGSNTVSLMRKEVLPFCKFDEIDEIKLKKLSIFKS